MYGAVVFDYGGVLSQPPYDGIVRHEAELGLPPGTLRDFFREGHDVYDEFLCGRISGREFMKAIGTHVQEHHGQRIDLSALAAALAYDVEPRMIELLPRAARPGQARDPHQQREGGELARRRARRDRRRRRGLLGGRVAQARPENLRTPRDRARRRPARDRLLRRPRGEPAARARDLGMVAFRFETPEVCRRQLADVGVL